MHNIVQINISYTYSNEHIVQFCFLSVHVWINLFHDSLVSAVFMINHFTEILDEKGSNCR